jgi:hypothetical protein
LLSAESRRGESKRYQSRSEADRAGVHGDSVVDAVLFGN